MPINYLYIILYNCGNTRIKHFVNKISLGANQYKLKAHNIPKKHDLHDRNMSWCAQNHRGILIANWNLSSDSYSIRLQLRLNWYEYLYIKDNIPIHLNGISDIRLKFQVYMHSLLDFHYQYAQCNKIQMISWHECS